MPRLPDLGEIPQNQFDRIVASFPGPTDPERITQFKAWYTNRLIERVEQSEIARLDALAAEERATVIAALRASLPPRQAEPPLRLGAPKLPDASVSR